VCARARESVPVPVVSFDVWCGRYCTDGSFEFGSWFSFCYNAGNCCSCSLSPPLLAKYSMTVSQRTTRDMFRVGFTPSFPFINRTISHDQRTTPCPASSYCNVRSFTPFVVSSISAIQHTLGSSLQINHHVPCLPGKAQFHVSAARPLHQFAHCPGNVGCQCVCAPGLLEVGWARRVARTVSTCRARSSVDPDEANAHVFPGEA
jgi:hypothetical protein